MIEDQKIKQDEGKLQLTLCPRELIEGFVKVREYGLKKYSYDTWKDVSPDRYMNAIFRHLLECKDNIYKSDEESGCMHLEHIVCNIGFLLALLNVEPEKPLIPKYTNVINEYIDD